MASFLLRQGRPPIRFEIDVMANAPPQLRLAYINANDNLQIEKEAVKRQVESTT